MSGYTTQDAYDAYITYLALQRHFTTSYDYFKYNGKVNASHNSFETRKDQFQFYKLSKKQDYKNYMLANIIEKDGKIWVGDLFTKECEHIYTEWLKKIQSLAYSFKQEIKNLNEDFDINFKVSNGQHPPVLNMILSRKISLETLIILNDILDIFPYWESKIESKIVWNSVRQRCTNYAPFLNYDRKRMKGTLIDQFD